MKKLPENPKIILASKSPRRSYLLKNAGLQFSVIPSNFKENAVLPASPEVYVETVARSKTRTVADRYPESWVIGADTIVLIEGVILGKPRTETEAFTMLNRLSNKAHQVLTGYHIYCKSNNRMASDVVSTTVFFKKLTRREIHWYIGTGEPFDKAGAYAIQGVGSFLVKSINGSYTNVVGLPVCEVVDFFLKEGVMDLPSKNTRDAG